jgi:hypothetical protein
MLFVDVRLLSDGTFRVKSNKPRSREYQVRYKADNEEQGPWEVLFSVTNKKKAILKVDFDSLDVALDYCVCGLREPSVKSTNEIKNYGISLPCGRYISRPGRVEIEKILCSFGWIFVRDISGYTTDLFHKNETKEAVFNHFSRSTNVAKVRLFDVYHCEQEGELLKALWVADFRMEVNRLIHRENLTKYAFEAFEQNGLIVSENIDFTSLGVGKDHKAQVIKFSDYHHKLIDSQPVKISKTV